MSWALKIFTHVNNKWYFKTQKRTILLHKYDLKVKHVGE